ncbi:hypothetical protein [Methanosarcina mazei]|uniref:Uncharacterized protein n=1 Tax=Methanosarcina mazei TaxID=2209 RepID=A0A6C0VJK6_METMZ|nr:hypothetical protein [Methanosarcina mazei]QIB91639.1 hypothetical protein FQU78_11870 [Methanosarcina mazei]
MRSVCTSNAGTREPFRVLNTFGRDPGFHSSVTCKWVLPGKTRTLLDLQQIRRGNERGSVYG